AVDFFLDRKVLQLAVMIRVVHLEYRDGSARTRHINSLETGIEFNDVRAASHREERDGLMSVQVKDGHEFIPFTGEERAMMLRVEGHSMISFTPPDRISPYDFIVSWINHGENVPVLQVDVHLTRNWIVLRHACFAVEVQ